MRVQQFFIVICAFFSLTSCTLINLNSDSKHYPLPVDYNKPFTLSVEYNRNILKYPVSYKRRTISLTEKSYFPAKWIMPDLKKKTPAFPIFSNPTNKGLTLNVSLNHNRSDNTLNLLGDFNYVFAVISTGNNNLYLPEENSKLYKTIINHKVITYSSTFQIVNFELNKRYEINLVDTPEYKKSIYLTISKGSPNQIKGIRF